MSVYSPDSPIVEQGILLRELNHRINNGLASAISLVSAAAVRVEGAEAKRAGPGCLDSAPLDLSGFLPGYAERGALRFCRCVGRA
ncbi:hypothetical protein ABIF99_000684 [Bradyrhizobium japonicum]|nr:hypothetical protein [Bradyrhizobium japonicum]MCP1865377.1 hypothetical protein [Bradyrhizobium japonicum]MCP1895851.1 hypothetical protein [Bradyrhizobium japonicum]MCW2329234.1 hypothetical protein [Bradyrhizobium japonicum]